MNGGNVSDGSLIPAGGWYADPMDAAQLRWWDGVNWTRQTTPASVASGDTAPAVEPVAAPAAALLASGVPFFATVGGPAPAGTPTAPPQPTGALFPGLVPSLDEPHAIDAVVAPLRSADALRPAEWVSVTEPVGAAKP